MTPRMLTRTRTSFHDIGEEQRITYVEKMQSSVIGNFSYLEKVQESFITVAYHHKARAKG